VKKKRARATGLVVKVDHVTAAKAADAAGELAGRVLAEVGVLRGTVALLVLLPSHAAAA